MQDTFALVCKRPLLARTRPKGRTAARPSATIWYFVYKNWEAARPSCKRARDVRVFLILYTTMSSEFLMESILLPYMATKLTPSKVQIYRQNIHKDSLNTAP